MKLSSYIPKHITEAKSSIKKQLDELDGTSLERELEKAEKMLKIAEDEGHVYSSLAKEADALHKKNEYPELKREAESLHAKAKKKEEIYEKLKKHIEKLKSEIHTTSKTKKLDERKSVKVEGKKKTK